MARIFTWQKCACLIYIFTFLNMMWFIGSRMDGIDKVIQSQLKSPTNWTRENNSPMRKTNDEIDGVPLDDRISMDGSDQKKERENALKDKLKNSIIKYNPASSILSLVDAPLIEPDDENIECVTGVDPLERPVPFCLLDSSYDQEISAAIRISAGFLPPTEEVVVRRMMAVLDRTPDAGLIDLGAGIGQISVWIARLERPVVAVEPRPREMRTLQKTIALSEMSSFVTTVHAVVSDDHQEMRVAVGDTSDTTLLHTKDCPLSACHSFDLVETIVMNDLLQVITFKTAILRLDLKEFSPFEDKVFSVATDLLSYVSIIQIYLKSWIVMTLGPEKKAVDFIAFLATKGYNPSRVTSSELDSFLPADQWANWPDDVLWIKTTSQS